MIENSNKIFKAINTVESSNICNSTMVVNSSNVIDSKEIFNSSEIIGCEVVSNSHFCQNSKNIKNCMFCSNVSNVEYYIFNKPVSKERYELFERQYNKYWNGHLAFIRDWPEDLLVGATINPTRKFDDWYYPISKSFWKWVKTLPNFDSMLIYDITMLPEILVD
jgi:hypothetical protein